MGKSAKEKLNQALSEHLNTIHETLQVLDQPPPASLSKVQWSEVIKMGEQLSKQATTVGMLWTGEKPEVTALKENMATYFNTLQGLLLLSHGSTLGAGPTLLSCMHTSLMQVVNSSFVLMKESISSYGSGNKDQKLSIPQLVGTVWDACSALKKTPATNITAIGRAMTQVAVSIKDVLREINELKPVSSASVDKDSDEVTAEGKSNLDSDDSLSADLGLDLSPEEMKVAQLAAGVVSELLVVLKEMIRCITVLLKQGYEDDSADKVDSLERILKLCGAIGEQVDELGACLYPPQEVSTIKSALEKILSSVNGVKGELEILNGTSEEFLKSYASLRSSLKELESGLSCIVDEALMPKVEHLFITEEKASTDVNSASG